MRLRLARRGVTTQTERETCPGSLRAGLASPALYSKVEDPIDAYCAACGSIVPADNRGTLLQHDRAKLSTRDRYYFRSMRYHVWAVMRRHDDNMDASAIPNSDLDQVEEWVGPREHGGDAGAKEYGRARVAALNVPASVTDITQEVLRRR